MYGFIEGTTLTEIADAIREKLGSIDTYKPSEMPEAILSIEAGGGSGEGGGGSALQRGYINFYDYDGTLLYVWTETELNEATELPALPTHNGLICQGWNWTLSEIKAENAAVDVGAIYITDDGKTRLYIDVESEDRLMPNLVFSHTSDVNIDWGDGCSSQAYGSGTELYPYAYDQIGSYVITLSCPNGTITLGNDTVSIMNNDAVYGNMLKKVELGSNALIESYSFSQCENLKTITIPNGITNIGNYVFNYCWNLKFVSIPKSITTIGNSVFNRCYGLSTISLSPTVTTMGARVFYDSCGMTDIVLPTSITSIGNELFYNCYNLISATTHIIGASMFYSCRKLKTVLILGNITTINDYALYGCRGLKKVDIPSSVTSIGSNALAYCSNMPRIDFPSSVREINSNAFAYCAGVKYFDFSNHTAVPTLSSYLAFHDCAEDYRIRVPSALYDAWIVAKNWSDHASRIVAV